METDKEVVQAVVIMDQFNNNFKPITYDKPLGLLPIAGVPLIDYVLESLVAGGVGEVYLYCCQEPNMIKEHIKKRKQERVPWSLMIDIQVLISDTCQTMGDVMRDLDSSGIIRGYYILLGVNTITNVNFVALLEQHKMTCKKDKGAAMTLVYKEVSRKHPLIRNDTFLLAGDGNTNKVLLHKKYKMNSEDTTFPIPLDCVLQHSEVKLHHNLVDSNIAICSPSVMPLFSDNFDFQTKNDFIHGLLINEDILESTLYYTLVKGNQYAAAVTNWKTYQTVCWDILHKWAHPLSIETGLFCQNTYMYMGNHNFRKTNCTLSRSCNLVDNVIIGSNTNIGDTTTVSKSYIGDNCQIGNNTTISGCHIMNNVVIKDNCKLVNCYIDSNSTVEGDSFLEGVIAVANVKIKEKSKLKGTIIDESENNFEPTLTKRVSETGTEWENESLEDVEDFIGLEKEWSDSDSCYTWDSSVETSTIYTPVPEDTNIFFQEVVDSLARGYEEKLKCDYLILEINSSRYAYNIQLSEVNFFVVKAMLHIPILVQSKNVVTTVRDIFKFLKPVLNNYIKTKSAISECLNAVEGSCIDNEYLSGKTGAIVQLLYSMDIVDEDSLLEWYESIESEVKYEPGLIKFIDWLKEASEESEGSE